MHLDLDLKSRCGSGGSLQAWADNCRFVLSMLSGTSQRRSTGLCTCDPTHIRQTRDGKQLHASLLALPSSCLLPKTHRSSKR
jgi:hypothetical protein